MSGRCWPTGTGASRVPPDQPDPHFGDVWLVTLADQQVPRLIVSSDMYHAARPDAVLAVVVDTPESPSYTRGLITEQLPDIGVAHLDLLTNVARSRLIRRLGHAAPERHDDIGRRVRNLIGP